MNKPQQKITVVCPNDVTTTVDLFESKCLRRIIPDRLMATLFSQLVVKETAATEWELTRNMPGHFWDVSVFG